MLNRVTCNCTSRWMVMEMTGGFHTNWKDDWSSNPSFRPDGNCAEGDLHSKWKTRMMNEGYMFLR